MYIEYNISKIIRAELETPIAEKVCYFVEYYFYCTGKYQNLDLEGHLLDVHAILRVIRDELDNKGNKRNLNFMKQCLDKIIGLDIVAKEHYGYLLEDLKEHILSDKEYSAGICDVLLKRMDQGKYAVKLCEKLEEILFDSESLDRHKRNIKYITKALINEQYIYGYSKESINDLLKNMFAGWEKVDEYVYTHYPFAPIYTGAQKYEELTSFMERLTVCDRIADIKNVFQKEKEKYILLCGISGMKGTELDIEVGKVKIYNAANFPKYPIEMDEQHPFSEDYFSHEIHASVEVQSLDYGQTRQLAKNEFEKAIDIICCYQRTEVPIYVDMSVHLILDEEYKVRGDSHSIGEGEARRQIRGINYDYGYDIKKLQELYNKYSVGVLEERSELAALIQNSGRWFRKGEDASRVEDKLLNYWIGLENAFPGEMHLPQELYVTKEERWSKFDDIYALVPMMFVRKNILDYFWELFNYTSHCYMEGRHWKEDSRLPISEDMARACGFYKAQNIYLVDFLNHLSELIACAPDGVLKDKLIEAEGYLLNPGAGIKLVNRQINLCRECILISYRFRNLIVHNAKYEMEFIEYYTQMLRTISSSVIVMLIERHAQNPESDLSSLLLQREIENQELKEELKHMGLLDWIRNLD